MKLSYRKDLNIASIKSESEWNKFKVHTLLQNTEQKQPSINAYLGARYSRSSDSILDIASEIIESKTDASEKLEKIFAGYGHKSVGDMADLFVCIENIPLYVAMRIFYATSTVSGQERSTRYQNFENPEFVKMPKEICEDRNISKGYERIVLKQMKDYRELLKSSKEQLINHFRINPESPSEVSALKARAFDTARYLLPLGINTSAAYLMSARSWSEIISQLCSSDNISENEIADMLLNLLGDSKLDIKGYVREAGSLIRHTDPNCCRKTSTKEILKYLDERISRKQIKHIPENQLDAVEVAFSPDSTETLISNYELLLNPLGTQEEFEFTDEDQEVLGDIIFENHNHHNLMGNMGQSGAIKISGFADIGVLKDLNRHRSMERYIPWLHDEIDMEQELNRSNEDCIYLCSYLDIPQLSKLRKEYQSRLSDTYDMIRKWRKEAKDVIAKEVIDEYTKYLLPYAHTTKYVMYGSFDDLQYVINLRTRNGGHIAYRTLTYEWLRKLSIADPIWRPLLKKTIKPLYDDKAQFVDRS